MGDVRTMDSVDEAGYYLYDSINWSHDASEYLVWYICTFAWFNNYCLQKEYEGILD
jgi:hypothetical protein